MEPLVDDLDIKLPKSSSSKDSARKDNRNPTTSKTEQVSYSSIGSSQNSVPGKGKFDGLSASQVQALCMRCQDRQYQQKEFDCFYLQ